MMSGKRGQPPPVKRTASMTEFTLDFFAGGYSSTDGVSQPTAPPLSHLHRHKSADFLRACSLCRRRLIPGRDIYMYRGDNTFCSEECRQHQINEDEARDKCSIASNTTAAAPSSAAGPHVMAAGETITAV